MPENNSGKDKDAVEKFLETVRELAGCEDSDESAATPKDGKRFRVALDFSFNAYSRLKAIREKARVKTNAELIRNALRLMEWYLEKQAAGYSLGLVKDGKLKKEIDLEF